MLRPDTIYRLATSLHYNISLQMEVPRAEQSTDILTVPIPAPLPVSVSVSVTESVSAASSSLDEPKIVLGLVQAKERRAEETREIRDVEPLGKKEFLPRPGTISSALSMPDSTLEETKGVPAKGQMESIRADLKKRLSLGLSTPRLGSAKRTDGVRTQEERFKQAIHQRIAEAELGSFADLKGELEAKYEIKEILGEVA